MPDRFKTIRFYKGHEQIDKIESRIIQYIKSGNMERMMDWLNVIAHNFKPISGAYAYFNESIIQDALWRAEKFGYTLSETYQSYSYGYFIESEAARIRRIKKETQLSVKDMITTFSLEDNTIDEGLPIEKVKERPLPKRAKRIKNFIS